MQLTDWVITKPKPPQNAPVIKDPPIHFQLVQKYVTEKFLQQGIEEVCDGSFEKRNIGNFTQWVETSLASNSKLQQELRDNNVKWDKVSKEFKKRATGFFFRKRNL
jgi:hypothetical protein